MIMILTKKNSFIGREYAFQISKKNINCCLVQVGKKIDNKIEINRSKKYWQPITVNQLKKRGVKILNFKNLKVNFKKFIKKNNIKIGIQAGIGILNPKIIESFKQGIINCHPGDIPKYRGSSCPEYQIYDKKMVKVTFHYIDERIDAGYLICKKRLKLNYDSYSLMRSTIYKAIAKEIPEVIKKIDSFRKKKINIQNSKIRSYIGDDKILYLKRNWKNFKPYLVK